MVRIYFLNGLKQTPPYSKYNCSYTIMECNMADFIEEKFILPRHTGCIKCFNGFLDY